MNKITKIIVGAVILALVVWGGVKLLGTKEEKTTETIKIGAIYGLTGPLAGLGEMFKNGAVFATDDINNSGGIKGRKLSLLIEDGQSDVKNSVSAFQKLVDIEGVKYIDSFGSAINLALKPLAEEKKVILLANSSHPKITEGVKFILRHSNIASSDAKILIDEVKKKSPSKVGIIYLNDDWGVVFNKKFQQMLRDSNPLIEIISESHLPKDTDMRTQILKILSGKPDLVLIASFGPASGIIVKQLKEMNYSGDIFMNIGLHYLQMRRRLQVMRQMEFIIKQ